MIAILLASYNGEQFIAEQIKSLLAQTVQDFKIYINDDKSTDATWKIVSDFAKENPDKIVIYQNEVNSGAAEHNFINMMIKCKDDYIMLCDQDDVWLPNKIELTFSKMKTMEAEFGKDTPLLVHTDLTVVDENLEIVSPSFKAAMNANYGKMKLRNQIIQNTLTGCTVMYNKALASLITDIPQYMVMHDWWLMLCAAAFGKIAALDEQTILYRQHRKNEVGAKDVRTLSYKFKRFFNYSEIKTALNITYMQAQSFYTMFEGKLSDSQKKLLTAYCDIPNHNKFVRAYKIWHLGTLKNGFSRRVAQFMFI